VSRPKGTGLRAEEASRVFTIRMSPLEILYVIAAAKKTRTSPSEWARQQLIAGSFECNEGNEGDN
jgi:hypothetical protein